MWRLAPRLRDNPYMAKNHTADQIIDELWNHPENAEWTPKVKVIPGAGFREWMRSADIEVLGVAYSLLGDHRFEIEPSLSLEEYIEFVRRYYTRCIMENPDGDWSDSRFSAAWDLVNVVSHHWRESSVPRSVMDDWKKWLADLYRESDEEIRNCIVCGTLEHLLEQGVFREFFTDWTRDPVLRKAYDEALSWYHGGGRTPLGKPEAIQGRVRSKRKKH
jgi:hypothetical protein